MIKQLAVNDGEGIVPVTPMGVAVGGVLAHQFEGTVPADPVDPPAPPAPPKGRNAKGQFVKADNG